MFKSSAFSKNLSKNNNEYLYQYKGYITIEKILA